VEDFYGCYNYYFVSLDGFRQLFGSDDSCSGPETGSGVRLSEAFGEAPASVAAEPRLSLPGMQTTTYPAHSRSHSDSDRRTDQQRDRNGLRNATGYDENLTQLILCVCQCLVCAACLTLRGFPSVRVGVCGREQTQCIHATHVLVTSGSENDSHIKTQACPA